MGVSKSGAIEGLGALEGLGGLEGLGAFVGLILILVFLACRSKCSGGGMEGAFGPYKRLGGGVEGAVGWSFLGGILVELIQLDVNCSKL